MSQAVPYLKVTVGPDGYAGGLVDALSPHVDRLPRDAQRYVLDFTYATNDAKKCLRDVARHLLESTGIDVAMPDLNVADPEGAFQDWATSLRFEDTVDEPFLQVVMIATQTNIGIVLVLPVEIDVETVLKPSGATFDRIEAQAYALAP